MADYVSEHRLFLFNVQSCSLELEDDDQILLGDQAVEGSLQ